MAVNDLDRAINSKPGYISRIENDEILSVGSEKLALIGEALEVSLDHLVRDIGTLEGAKLVRRRLREVEGWSDALAQLRQRYPDVPDEEWQAIGDLGGPRLPGRVDALLIESLRRDLQGARAANPDEAKPWRDVTESGALPVGRQRGRPRKRPTSS